MQKSIPSAGGSSGVVPLATLASSLMAASGSSAGAGYQDKKSATPNSRVVPPKSYPFTTQPIPRYHWQDKRAKEALRLGQPVILLESNIAQSAVDRWDWAYLQENLATAPMNVYTSDTSKFMYYDDSRNFPALNYPCTRKLNVMKFGEFLECVKIAELFINQRIQQQQQLETPQNCTASPLDPAVPLTPAAPATTTVFGIRPGTHVYLQQVLSSNVGPRIVQDFLHFNWKLLGDIQRDLKWRDLTTNLLLVGMAGVVTPAHYDEQENVFAQIRGTKRCLLFSPEQYRCLYPFPVHHPCDRQSQVDFDNPDLTRFPKFPQAHAWECVLEPGEVLYIPTYWWHHIESLTDSVSINFWYLAAPTPSQIVYPLTAAQETAMMRNVEKMVGDALGNPLILHRFWHDMIDGRYFYPTPEEQERQRQQPTYVHNASEAHPSLQQIAQQLSGR